MLLHCIRFDHCQCLLLREEEVDLSFCIFMSFTAVQLVDRLVLHSKLGPETEGSDTEVSITGIIRILGTIYI